MESLQAPHQEHDPRHQAQETWTQTYQIYADAAASSGYFDFYSFSFLFIVQLFTYHR